MKHYNVITLFSGYDSQLLALRRLETENVKFNCVAWAEIDDAAIKAHNALFPELKEKNVGDVGGDWAWQIPCRVDLLTYSSPCQSFSRSGKLDGGARGSGTRSAELWHVEKAVQQLRPKFLLFENVPTILADKVRGTLTSWAATLEGLGYRNYHNILSAKNFGIPQDRERFFMVSVLNDSYEFPKPEPPTTNLIDFLSVFAINTTQEGASRTLTAHYAKLGGMQFVKKHHGVTGVLSFYAGLRQAQNIDEVFHRVPPELLDLAKEKGWIRKFTPRECFRLMGLTDKEALTLIASGLSKTKLYKLAGNSIVVNVLVAIFRQMFWPKRILQQLTLNI